MARPTSINRDLYRKIKSMSREQLEATLNNIYDTGIKDALDNAVIDLDMDKLRSDLGTVSGIGEKRLEQIMEIITRNIREADSKNASGEKPV
ncbi:MAG: hypothetical protein J6O50_13215 [Ruminiclostridium sp.]|nr:hypothetical protein [Ruminiclostridium sp.]